MGIVRYRAECMPGTVKYIQASEHEHQVCFFEAINQILHECVSPSPREGKYDNTPCNMLDWLQDAVQLTYAIPNGGARDSNANTAKLIGAQLKMEGVRPGIFDISCDMPMGTKAGLKIEFKKYGGKMSDLQKEYFERYRKNHFSAICCVGWLPAVKAWLKYMQLENEDWIIFNKLYPTEEQINIVKNFTVDLNHDIRVPLMLSK